MATHSTNAKSVTLFCAIYALVLSTLLLPTKVSSQSVISKGDTSSNRLSNVAKANWRPQHNEIAITFGESSDIIIVDGSTLVEKRILKSPAKVAPSLGVSDFAWSPNGYYLASAFEDDNLDIWSVGDPKATSLLSIQYKGRTPSLSWSADSTKIAVAWGDDENRRILIYDAATGTLLQTLQDDKNRFKWVMWSPDGKYLLSYTSTNIHLEDWQHRYILWDAQTYQKVKQFGDTIGSENSPERTAVWSPDSAMVVGTDKIDASGAKSLWLYDMASGELSRPFKFTGKTGIFFTMAWSPDGLYIAACAESQRVVYVWNTITKALVATLGPFSNGAGSLSWRSDSQRLAVVAGTLQFWDVPIAG